MLGTLQNINPRDLLGESIYFAGPGMSKASTYALVLSMCPDDDTAQLIARSLVESRLAASVNILPGLRSIYWWQGKVTSAEEHLLLIKTRRDRYPDVEGMIRKQHPYELPSIVCVPIDTGLSHYFAWIDKSINETS